jgi:NTE family protein
MWKILAACLVLLIGLIGCQSTPHNSKPKCEPCSQFVDFQKPVAMCPSTPPFPDHINARKWTNLVLEGGGVKGVAYAGSFAALHHYGLLDDLDHVAGTSAGALLALILSLGYSADEMQQVVMQLDFKKFKDGDFLGDLHRLTTDYGVYKGNYAQCVLECLVEHKTGNRLTNFTELQQMKVKQHKPYRDPVFFSTNVNTSESIEFSASSNAGTPVAIAARMSMSIPFFFAAREFEGDTFVDGGVLRNYAIEAFDVDGPNAETLGLHLGGQPGRVDIENLAGFTKQMFTVLLNMQIARLCDVPADVKRSVFIPTLGIGTTDFNLTSAQKCDLMQSGQEAMIAYLTTADPSGTCPVNVQAIADYAKRLVLGLEAVN